MRAEIAEAPPQIDDGPLKIDPMLWLIPLILSSIGILMVTSTTSPTSFASSGTPFVTGMRQFNWLLLGMGTMIVTMCIPIRFWYRISGPFWILAFLMVLATLVPGLGRRVGGAQRWLRLPGIAIQPSEILTLAVVFLTGKYFVRNELNPPRCFARVLGLIVISILPLIKQPDLGSIILILLICMGMYVERFGWKLPLFAGCVGSIGLMLFVLFEPYRMRRINAWLNPWQDPLDTGFQTVQGLIAFANGGAWGSGLGHGFQKLNYLPAAYTDFIYAALGEEIGLIGTLGLLTLCLLWVTRCRSLYNRAPEGYETSLVWGIMLTIVLPLFINVAGVTNLMPLTGMPLPFVSYGGSSLIVMWMRIGILLRVNREAVAELRT